MSERNSAGDRPKRCKRCGAGVSRVRLNHWLHGLLTLITFGLWGVSWIALAIDARLRPWRCKECNHRPLEGQ